MRQINAIKEFNKDTKLYEVLIVAEDDTGKFYQSLNSKDNPFTIEEIAILKEKILNEVNTRQELS